ncbi:Asp23/Gls24 family envelope stress response protein [Eshraghiella crossota]|jgi:alkaline shock protein|uniref:Asp23/Gls24 family envelope stress response protein n=2 Tax=Eshraghiella crossota TaxID=45851 RepID=UPI000ECD5CAB|nr:Asp23/Gls24 family envelope stress response protein [Butyrivibrio crossotus]HAI92476.1 Asp23/Gls24 family envelope stress response protein [Butyrivibrio sp.]
MIDYNNGIRYFYDNLAQGEKYMEKEAHIQNTDIGNIHISEEVIAVIAGIAATEGPEVYSLVGNITNEIVSKMGIKSLSKGIKVDMAEDTVTISVTVNLVYGYNIPKTCQAIQERIIQSVESMTGMSVAEVNVNVNDITTEDK